MNQAAIKIVQLLTIKEMTLSLAESCTGGGVAHLITQVAGSSAIFKGGLVAYDTNIKRDILKVDGSIIDGYGVVSRETAMGMALGCARLFKTDWTLATTGYAGPGGGDSEHPVGTVYISIYSHRCQRSGVWRFDFNGTREEVMAQAAEKALLVLLRMLS